MSKIVFHNWSISWYPTTEIACPLRIIRICTKGDLNFGDPHLVSYNRANRSQALTYAF
jgi:hypothetical protein